jgi:hypothetical protein
MSAYHSFLICDHPKEGFINVYIDGLSLGQFIVAENRFVPDQQIERRNPFGSLDALREHVIDVLLKIAPRAISATVAVSSGGVARGTSVPPNEGACDSTVPCPKCGVSLVVTKNALICPDCDTIFHLREEPTTFASTGTIAHGVPVTLTTDITINGRKVTIEGEVLSYEKAVELANTRWGKDAPHTVVYWRRCSGDCQNSGLLAPGKPVQMLPGMHVTAVVVSGA